MIELRPAVHADAAALADVTAAAEGTYGDWAADAWTPGSERQREFSRGHWVKLLDQRERWTWVAMIDARVVGVASVRTGDEPDAGHLGYLFVHPDAWGAGVGRALLEAALEEIRRRGHAKATLRVPVANERARRLYERNGFVDTGRRQLNRWLGFEMAVYERPV